MISFREISYDTNQDPEEVFSRLTWAVEKVDGLTRQLINRVTVDTNRPWVGNYDKANLNFGLIEPRGYFSLNFLQVVVRGQITRSKDKTIVTIKLRLGWETFLTFAVVYLSHLVMLALVIAYGPTDVVGLLWLLILPVIGAILLNQKLNSVEKKIEELFGF